MRTIELAALNAPHAEERSAGSRLEARTAIDAGRIPPRDPAPHAHGTILVNANLHGRSRWGRSGHPAIRLGRALMMVRKIGSAWRRAAAALVVLSLVLLPLAGAFAQTAAPAPAAAAPAAAAPADPAPPACDAKTLEKCTPNSGDTAWMLTSVALVLLMTVPGLGLFYGGMVRKKNVGDTIMTSFAITCLVTVLWAIVNYSTAFRPGTPFIGGLDRAFLQNILSDIAKGIGNPNPLAPTIPETVYMCFQMTFAIITPALIAGAFAERMKFSAMLWFIGLWAVLVYAPVAHWVWGPDGFLSSANSD